MAENLVDVAAAAARLVAQQRTKSADEVRSTIAGTDCPLGHGNAGGAKYCAECGLPMGEMVLGSREDLSAIRESLKPGSSLSQDERLRRDREHAEALAANAQIEQRLPTLEMVEDTSEKKVMVHFLEDGFTWHRVWYRGDELTIGPDHPYWQDAQRWIRLSKSEQFDRYGRIFFDYGPWPGRRATPGTETRLPNADPNRWAELKGQMPATSDREGALIPF